MGKRTYAEISYDIDRTLMLLQHQYQEALREQDTLLDHMKDLLDLHGIIPEDQFKKELQKLEDWQDSLRDIINQLIREIDAFLANL